MKYYYVDRNNQTAGPVTQSVLEDLIGQGHITVDTPVMSENGTAWIAYKEYPFDQADAPSTADGKGNDPGGAKKKKGEMSWGMVMGIIAGMGCLGMIFLGVVALFVFGKLGADMQKQAEYDHVRSIGSMEVLSMIGSQLSRNKEARELLGDNIEVEEPEHIPIKIDADEMTLSATIYVKGDKARGTIKIFRKLKHGSIHHGPWSKYELTTGGKAHNYVDDMNEEAGELTDEQRMQRMRAATNGPAGSTNSPASGGNTNLPSPTPAPPPPAPPEEPRSRPALPPNSMRKPGASAPLHV
ncbi:hypothetical protein DB346_23775 [Verrucomicrobia bacterium LW23]|nr:hypothetical protein DB346_23775 [Verrucomicrobia bacterium LW23]